MFTIKDENVNFLELKSTNSKAIISLNEGERLQELQLNNQLLIKEITGFSYENSYASSILFPFANRIENGKYTFKENEYEFECNDGKNALHGLVYNKPFTVEKKIESLNYAAVTLIYQEKEESLGFPFTYKVELIYTLYKDEISVSVKIENTDTKPFPFTLGWHPYFFSEDLENSSLNFKSDKKIEFDENLITKKITDYKADDKFT
ncbi:aldose 1-epimerase [uncultured Polaribacter sp.]|uniref:aldose 1-epimerase n=1 Tax=uncultured Polaribacter sp. TaxID=174711 RepID=UPI00260DFB7D|nr:aldose 1-epimerase [uncultured Polaribacter sp.]